MRVLVTGAAGFIGFHLTSALLALRADIFGVDNLNDYYDVRLKEDRLRHLTKPGFRFEKLDLSDFDRVLGLFRDFRPEVVVHLAAQAGVRYSLQNPRAYTRSNIDGFLSILEGCRAMPPRHLVFASSSSVYGDNAKVPFSVHDRVDHPISLYAATKKSNELMAHTYSHLFGIPATGLRFFTVYGPWGRPDMAYFSFTKAIIEGRPIQLFGEGNMERDFTYIDDVVDAVVKVMEKAPASKPPIRIYNVGNHRPVKLREFLEILERLIGKKAEIKLAPMQPGDVRATYADIEDTAADFGFQPRTSIEEGLTKFVEWYKDYYRVSS